MAKIPDTLQVLFAGQTMYIILFDGMKKKSIQPEAKKLLTYTVK